MDRVLEKVNCVNESMSIYRAAFICRNDEEVAQVVELLLNDDYACVTEVDEEKAWRMYVSTLHDFLDATIDYNELTVLFTTDIHNLDYLTYFTKTNGNPLLVLL